MSERKDGGPAFPLGCPEMAIAGQEAKETQGMTLRDYFAAKAMCGMLSDSNYNPAPEHVAKHAYAMADAMLEARDINHG